ncbi:hypothetical protein BRARA_A00010 [Brassica rapa]|uniref:Uncharacterized protein n=1 Tax=Brassica campestris TaxID=3711 RepID=A0A398AGX4_BRACM|nr:hypothetical protein BRARA_A00010 [Brassica rapa]
MFQRERCLWFYEVHPGTSLALGTSSGSRVSTNSKGKGECLKESRGGFGLWTSYPGDLDSVELPQVVRTSNAG